MNKSPCGPIWFREAKYYEVKMFKEQITEFLRS